MRIRKFFFIVGYILIFLGVRGCKLLYWKDGMKNELTFFRRESVDDDKDNIDDYKLLFRWC